MTPTVGVPGVGLAFDHHASEAIRVEDSPENHIIVPSAMSTARVVYDYYGGAERFPTISDDMMDAVDKADAARFSEEEILDPQGWILMSLPDGPAHRPRPLPRVPDLQTVGEDHGR